MVLYWVELGVYSRDAADLAAILQAYDIGYTTRNYGNHRDVFNGNILTVEMTWFSARIKTRRLYEELLRVLEESDLEVALTG